MDLRIKEIVKLKGLTQKELADKMGVSLSAVKQMLNADSLTTSTLEKIAGALGCSVADFFREKAEPQSVSFLAVILHNGEVHTFSQEEDFREYARTWVR